MSLHNFPCLGHGSIGLCVERSTCARCQVCTFMSVVLLRHERPAAAGFLFYGVVTPQCRGNDECLLSGKHTGFYQNRCSRFFCAQMPKGFEDISSGKVETENEIQTKMETRRSSAMLASAVPQIQKKRLLNKPCIGYEAEEECIYGKRSVLRSANSCQHRRSAA